MVEAFPFDTPPRYLVRDRDGIYGDICGARWRAISTSTTAGASINPWRWALPTHRRVHPPELGDVVEFPDVGGLQRHYERRAP